MKKLLILVTALLYIGIASNACALTNPGFETGDFTGWTQTIPAGATEDVVSSHTGLGGANYGPVEGDFFALLKAESYETYTALSQVFNVNAGDILSGWAALDARDFGPFNDTAQVVILQSTSVVATPWQASVSSLGDYADGPWTEWNWTAPSAGSYAVSLRVINGGDDSGDSYALFDAHSLEVVPEPATLILLGFGTLGFGFFRRKKLF